MQLTNEVQTVRVQNAAAAGTTVLNSSSVDMLGWDGVRGVFGVGTLTAGQVTSLKAQDSPDNSAFTDITGAAGSALADGDGNGLLIVDVYRPLRRYVRFVRNRATQNAVVDFGIAEQYRGPRRGPQTKDATVKQQLVTVGA